MDYDERRLNEEVQKVIDAYATAPEVSALWVATQVMITIRFARILHPLGYVGCHMALRQIAREKLRHQFDPSVVVAKALGEDEEDLFPETLQDRYPRHPHRGEERSYRLRELMNDEDVAYNVARMRKAGRALLKHADALEEWNKSRRASA
jgi:hypothetical protein